MDIDSADNETTAKWGVERIYGDALVRRWSEIVPLIDAALLHGSGSVTSYGLFIECLATVAQCWIDEDEYGDVRGAVITRFEDQEGTRIIAVIAASHPDWFAGGHETLERLEEFGRSEGCHKMNVYGRRGWLRVLAPRGYYEPYITLTKDLGGA